MQQRAPQLPHREVEGVGVEEGPYVVRAEREPLAGGVEEPYDVPVGDLDALGAARGARGVDDVGRVAGVGGRGGQRCGGVGERLGHRDGGDRACHTRAVRGHQQHRISVVEHEGQAVRRVLRVHRQIRGTGLQHREEGHHQIGRARQGQGDQALRTRAPPGEQAGQAVGALVQFRVRQPDAPVHHSRAVGAALDLAGEQLGERGIRNLGRTRLAEQLFPLARQQRPHFTDGARRGGRQGREHRGETVQERTGPALVVDVGPVGQSNRQAAAGQDGEGERVVGGVTAGELGDL